MKSDWLVKLQKFGMYTNYIFVANKLGLNRYEFRFFLDTFSKAIVRCFQMVRLVEFTHVCVLFNTSKSYNIKWKYQCFVFVRTEIRIVFFLWFPLKWNSVALPAAYRTRKTIRESITYGTNSQWDAFACHKKSST